MNADVMASAGKGRDGGLQTQGKEAWRVVRPLKLSKRNIKDMCKRAEEGGQRHQSTHHH